MVSRIQITLISLLCIFTVKAQEVTRYAVPDYPKIEQIVKNDKEGYNKLLDRFMASDTTLTFDELHLVYYGFPYSGNYNPMFTNNKLDASLAEPDPVKADSLCNEALKECSVSLRALVYPLMLHSNSPDDQMRKLAGPDIWRVRSIANVIFASGESDRENPLYTIFIADEYALLELMGLPKPSVQYTAGDEAIDTLVIKGENMPDGEFSIYFNVEPSRDFLKRMFEDIQDLKAD